MTKKGKGKIINLIAVITVGAIIGQVASKIMRTQGGLLVNIVVGIVGALLASFLFGRATLTSGSFAVVSLLGAIIVLAVYRPLFRGRRVLGWSMLLLNPLGLVSPFHSAVALA